MEIITAGEAMEALPRPLRPEMGLAELTNRLLHEHRDVLPVVDDAGAYRGVVTSRQVEEAMSSNEIDVTAESLMTEVTPVQTGESLQSALRVLVQRSRGGVPVVAAGHLVGWLSHRDVLRAYHSRLEKSVDAAAELAARSRSTATVGVLPSLPNLGDFRIVDLTLGEGSPAGCRVAEVRWPESSLLMAVRREGRVVIPRGDTVLQRGDRLTLLLPSGAADDTDLADSITRAHAEGAAQARGPAQVTAAAPACRPVSRPGRSRGTSPPRPGTGASGACGRGRRSAP